MLQLSFDFVGLSSEELIGSQTPVKTRVVLFAGFDEGGGAV